MLHYVSQNLWDWEFLGDVDLHSARVIDACVYETEPGLFKMWYKDENRESHTYAAVSRDLHRWEVLGEEVSDCAQEGPNVFSLGGKIWMISDFWSGLAVYSSEDCTHWTRCPNLLEHSGTRPMDVGLGHHADVVVRDDRAFLFYFCHPYACELPEDGNHPADFTDQQRNMAVVQVVELFVQDDHLVCDRNAPVSWPV